MLSEVHAVVILKRFGDGNLPLVEGVGEGVTKEPGKGRRSWKEVGTVVEIAVLKD
jgi:hypothetical protein